MILDVDHRHRNYYAYGTGKGFPVLHSHDLFHWRSVGRALSQRPSWVVHRSNWDPWGPSVLQTSRPCPGARSGPCFILYYASASKGSVPGNTRHPLCIGVATSAHPGGPFSDRGILQELAPAQGSLPGLPFGCGDAGGYTNIDPAPFVDRDGRAYLYFSTSHACASPPPSLCVSRPTISVVRLSANLLHAAGPREPLFSGTPGTWEQAPWGPVVEGPWMVHRGPTYFLFYSGGAYNRRYGMGYATASSPMGPFTKSAANPILKDSSHVLSTGGGSVVTGASRVTWMAYAGRPNRFKASRELFIAALAWTGGHPSMRSPTMASQSRFP